MLNQSMKIAWGKAYRDSINALGVPATVMPKHVECTVGFKTSTDVDIINAWGVGSKIITIQVADVPDLEKLDRVMIENERYTIEQVSPIHLNEILIAWRGVVRGQ
jgi:hypothetical protein